MATSPYRVQIAGAAGVHGVDAALLEALVLQESGGNPWAWNPEPRYRYLWDVRRGKPFRPLTPDEIASEVPPADFPTLAGDRDQEWWGQQASWGLCQVMGAVARERGFRDLYLTKLCDLDVNLDVAAGHLSHLLVWAHGDTWRAVAAYNAGPGNWTAGQAYADEVRTKLERITP